MAGRSLFVLRSAQSGLLSILSDRLRDLRAPQTPVRNDNGDKGAELTVFRIARRGPSWHDHPWGLWRDGEPCETVVTDDYIVAYVLWEVTRLVLERAAPLIPVHAAADGARRTSADTGRAIARRQEHSVRIAHPRRMGVPHRRGGAARHRADGRSRPSVLATDRDSSRRTARRRDRPSRSRPGGARTGVGFGTVGITNAARGHGVSKFRTGRRRSARATVAGGGPGPA